MPGMPFPPIITDRLVIRPPGMSDVEALFERRNHPGTARYQSWIQPYPLDAARRLLAAAVGLGGPTEGEWWMATVTARGSAAIVGDVAVRLQWQGRAATIGYTFHPDHWGRGHASEAAGAVIDHLIEWGVRRLSAMTHPDNLASVRVLERLGFGYEGRTIQSFFQGEGPDVQATDDLLFGMTAEARTRWSRRPTGAPARLRLVEIDDTNHRSVAALETHYSQRHLVAPVAASYGDALFPPEVGGTRRRPWLRAIEIDEGEQTDPELAGFVMLDRPTGAGHQPDLWRLLIDRSHQRRGIGTVALDLIEADLARDGHEAVTVQWVEGPGSPAPFFANRGYEPTGRVDGGRIEARKALALDSVPSTIEPAEERNDGGSDQR